MLLAFDDTDGPDGGCTTHAAFHALLAIPHLALRGLPRLVRLNPNCPHKTRGNAAVVLPLGLPEGPQVRVGELRGREILAFPEGRPVEPTPEVLDAVWRALSAVAQPTAQPAVALFREPPPAWAYWIGVRTRMDGAEAKSFLETEGILHRSAGSGRALVGCLAAAAWPGPPTSHEFTAYREPGWWGTERNVSSIALRGLDAAGTTFHTFDAGEERLCCVPHTPCPVLCALRGADPDALRETAVRTLPLALSEPVDGWLLWATNQASGDHVTPVASVMEAPEWATVEVEATVQGMPETRTGGHVFVALADAAGHPFQAAAFEPTRDFRHVVRSLRPGDRVTVVGALHDGTVNLEKLKVESLAEHRVKWENPRCPSCGKGMKSIGEGAGYRCRDCGGRVGPKAGEWRVEERKVSLGWNEVPVIARRHLHRPLGWPGSRQDQ